MKILADHPAKTVLAITGNIDLTNDKGYARTFPLPVFLKGFPGDKHEYIRSFTIGCDGDNAEKVWAFGNGSMITSSPRGKEIAAGIELGQEISIEGRTYRVEPDHNRNIKLTAI